MRPWGRAALLAQVFSLIGITLSSISASAQSRGGPSPTSVTVSYSLLTQQFTLHQPVNVIFKVTNDSSQTITLDLGQDRKRNFSFTITPPNGVTLKLSLPLKEGASLTGRLSVAPADTYSQSLVLNELYDFPITGKYEVEGHLTQPIVIGNGSSYQSDPGFHASIEVGPRDELSLSKTCEGLASQIEASNSSARSLPGLTNTRWLSVPASNTVPGCG